MIRYREPETTTGDVLVALAMIAALTLQHCYDPNKAPPVEPGYPPEAPFTASPKDAGKDAR